jgi:Bifunctional DNA primase/polymerase, N-terminal
VITLQVVKALLPEAVLLPIPRGEKGPRIQKWQEVTREGAESAAYQGSLHSHSNTGVLLGPPSGDLIAIDLDSDEAAKEFFAMNPELRLGTLITCGARGCQVWLQMIGDYPGEAISAEHGEWRGGGCQSVVRGIHPNGNEYQWLCDKPPKKVSFSELKLPSWLADAIAAKRSLAQENLSNSATNSAASDSPVVRYIKANTLAICERYLPNGRREGHEWLLGDLNGNAGESCKIELTGEKAGLAHDWNGGDGAGLLEVIANALGIDRAEAANRIEGDFAIDRDVSLGESPSFAERLEEDFGDSDIKPSKKDEPSKKQHLILPSGPVSIQETASHLFTQLAKTRRYFARGRLVQEVVCTKEGSEILSPLRANAFRSRMEKDFRLLVWRSPKGEPVLKPAHCPKDIAEALLETDQAIDFLPGIALLVSSPILAERDSELVVLNKGYHEIGGGVYIERRMEIKNVPLKEAVARLLELLQDFDFVTGADKSRAVASFLTPALRFGRILDADFPLDLAEADESQSGKTYRQKLACAIYGEKPYVIARRENGVGSLDESISCALLSGRPFVCLENVRGVIDSQILESAIRGHGHINVRVPHRGEVQLSTERVCWQLSSNQAATTRDLANRSVVTRIRKRAAGYQYQAFPEGDLLMHVQHNCGFYLSCVFSVLQAWFKAGKARTSDCRHDFREWSQSLDWIVQHLFSLPPLLDGHREEQRRISDPYLNWLRDVALAVEQSGKMDEGLRPGEIVDLCTSRGVVIPGHSRYADEDQQRMLVGRILNKIFTDANSISVGGFQVRRDQREEYSTERRRNININYFWFERPSSEASGTCAPCAPCASGLQPL